MQPASESLGSSCRVVDDDSADLKPCLKLDSAVGGAMRGGARLTVRRSLWPAHHREREGST